jgi:hypothetical protein
MVTDASFWSFVEALRTLSMYCTPRRPLTCVLEMSCCQIVSASEAYERSSPYVDPEVRVQEELELKATLAFIADVHDRLEAVFRKCDAVDQAEV